MNARYYAMQLQSARRTYEQTKDHTGYMLDCLYIASKIAADALAQEDRRFAHLPTTLTVASPAFKAVFATVASRLSCPVEAGNTHEDFLREAAREARHYIDRDYPPVGKIMTHLGI